MEQPGSFRESLDRVSLGKWQMGSIERKMNTATSKMSQCLFEVSQVIE